MTWLMVRRGAQVWQRCKGEEDSRCVKEGTFKGIEKLDNRNLDVVAETGHCLLLLLLNTSLAIHFNILLFFL